MAHTLVSVFIEYVHNKRLGNPISGFTYNFNQGLENFQDTVPILGGSCSSLGYEMQKQYSKPHFIHAKVLKIKDARHCMNMEKFDNVMIAIKSFLNAILLLTAERVRKTAHCA